MRSLKVDYSKQFSGLEEKPESYHELANNFEWAKREVDQDLEGYIHDEYNYLLDSVLADEKGNTIVECECGLGRNLHRFAADNLYVGVDFSSTSLHKIGQRGTGVASLNADIRYVPIADGIVDYVMFCNVLFIYQDLEEVERMLVEAHRMSKPGCRGIVIDGHYSIGVRLSPFMRTPPFDGGQQEFILYYYGKPESKCLSRRTGFTYFELYMCSTHVSVYHMTYLSPVWGVTLQHHLEHRVVRCMDHWERVRGSSSVNDSYLLNRPGRMLPSIYRRLMPSLAWLSLCRSAQKLG